MLHAFLLTCALTVLCPQRSPAPDTPTARQAPKKAGAKKQGVTPRRERRIRDRILGSRIARANVRVRVKLRNGENLAGIVKNGRFVERPAGLEFVRSEMTTKGAGLRLWYYNQTSGYIFLPYKQIRTYKVLKRLSDIELKELTQRILDEEKKAREQATKRRRMLERRAQDMRDGGQTTKRLEELAKEVAESKKREAENERLLALIKEFPPSEGWGPDKIQEINVRRLTLGVFPDARSRRFIQVFADWKKAKVLAEKVAKEEAEKTKADGKTGEKADSTEKRVPAEPAPSPGKSGTEPAPKPAPQPAPAPGTEPDGKPGGKPGLGG